MMQELEREKLDLQATIKRWYYAHHMLPVWPIMALEYQFVFLTESRIPTLLETVRQRCGLVWSEDHTFLTGPGVQVSGLVCSRSWQETMQEAFGFRPEAELYFRLARGLEEQREGYRVMLEVVTRWLQEEAGQGVLLFNGETILLQRLGTELTLNSDWQTWHKEGREKMTLPHTMQSLPSPLL